MQEFDKPKVAVIGLGTIGLGLSLELAKNKIHTTAIDIDTKKISDLKNNHSHIFDISDADLSKHSSYMTYSLNYQDIESCNVIIFCLPTFFKNDSPDISLLINAIKSTLAYLKKSSLVIIESTLYPGATKKEILPLFSEFSIGNNLFYSHSPERVDPGNKSFQIHNITKIVSGHTSNCLSKVMNFYGLFLTKLHPVSSIETAEMTKVFENYYKALNITMTNEIRPICESMGISIKEVIEAASTKEFGFQAHYPGPGIGGRCIPMAPIYLKHAAAQTRSSSQIIDGVIDVNKQVIGQTSHKIKEIANSLGKDVKILLLGMAYKKNINDFRESTSVKILKDLSSLNVFVSDPYLNMFEEFSGAEVIDSNNIHLKIRDFDLVVLLVDHDDFDIEKIRINSKNFYNPRQ